MAVFPLPLFRVNRLIALENNLGFTLALGIVTRIDRPAQQVTLLTPLSSLAGVDALRLGDLLLDPHTFMDERIH
jgi:polynucleotide 5'-kinase involved in rRNA processing